MPKEEDIWSKWLKKRRFGGDEKYQAIALEQFKKLASKIVNRAEIFESATVLDVGAGDGLVGLAALSKLGDSGKLILSDISEAALAIPREIFNEKKVQDSQIEFLVAGVEDLSQLSNGSVDRVLMRSVLLYVEDKQAAFNEIFRVLRHGGIAVLMEPINQRDREFGIGLFRGYNLDREPLLSVKPLLQRVADETRLQIPTSFLNYNEHDLIHYSTHAGFEEIQLEYTFLHTIQAKHVSWEAFFDTAPNPKASTLRELMTNVLNRKEFEIAERALRKAFQSSSSIWTDSQALLILNR